MQTHRPAILLSLTLLLLAPAVVGAQNGFGTATSQQSIWVMQDTKYKRLDTGFPSLDLDAPAQDFIVTYQEQTTGATPLDLSGATKPKGRLSYNVMCNGSDGLMSVASGTSKVDKNGNVYFSKRVSSQYKCNSVYLDTLRKGNYTVPAGTSVTTRFSAQKIHDGGCVPDASTLCLEGGRFQVQSRWNDGSRSGSGMAVPGGDELGTFYFFNPDNTEMLVKVLDGCNSPFNSFWVFAAAATDVEYTLTVTDTQSGQAKSWNNALGGASPAILDTDAFRTCP